MLQQIAINENLNRQIVELQACVAELQNQVLDLELQYALGHVTMPVTPFETSKYAWH